METSDELKKITDQVEYIFLKTIVTELRGKRMTADQARLSAQAFLKIEPFGSLDDAHHKIHQFVTTFPAFDLLLNYIDAYNDEKNVDRVIEEMRIHIKNNDLEQALIAAEGGKTHD
jgi:hypothetical protein